jgi:hypothetical protein
MKFLCDQMVAGLAKWLRAAGYDTKIVAPLEKDEDALRCAKLENRLLLTRDSRLLKMKSKEVEVFFLQDHSVEEWARELSLKLGINWLYRPFSRCLVCNSVFIEPVKEDIKTFIPSHLLSKKLWFCPECQKTYWEGSHTQNMLKQLYSWQTKIADIS